MRTTGCFTALLACAAMVPSARAQELDPSRILTPGMGLATDDATSSVSTNPALFAFDPDPGASLRYHQRIEDPLSAFHLSTSTSGAGLGLFYRNTGSAGSLWGMQTSLGLHLDDNLTLGSSLWWYLPQGSGNNFTTWDLGLGYRPLSWLGFGAVARNIGSPGVEWGVVGTYGIGVALRPFGDRAVLGVDQFFTDMGALEDSDLDLPERTTQLSLRVSPKKGLTLRAYGTQHLEVGAGLQLSFGGTAIGAYGAGLTGDSPAVVGSFETCDPNERVFGVLKRVALIRVHTELPYEPRATLFSAPQESYLHLLRRLEQAGQDPGIQGVVLHLDASPFSWGQVEELRGLVTRLSESGRPVVVYLDAASGNRDYYLATAADSVYLHPASELELTGLAAETLYFRGTLDLLGVEPEFYHRSEYKSAPERYTRHDPSEPASEQTNELLDDLYGLLVDAIATGRGQETELVRETIDGGPYTASEAEALGLVDGLVYPDQLEDGLNGVFPAFYILDEDYLADRQHSGWQAPRRIAVVLVAGAITAGESAAPSILGGGSAGAETIVKALDQALEDTTVKAVVLRVDSPGGSAYASDDIWRAVQRLDHAGKPVIVSMGGVAASGGYYVAAGADAIFAEPGTITGSIGVYGGKISLEGLYEKVGVGSTVWTRGRRAAMWSNSRPLDSVEREALIRLIDETYEQFKDRVAEGRDMHPDRVEDLARGRVYSGKRAWAEGLVDELGGLFDAVDRAREEAGIRPGARYELVTYSSDPDPLGELPRRLVRAVMGPIETSVPLPEGVQLLQSWSALEDEHLFMMLPYRLEVE